MDVAGRGVNSMLRRTNYEGLNALHAAVGGEGLLPMCRYLVEEVKMDVNKRDTFKGKKMTPLEHAVFRGNLPVVRYLLDHGADLHQEGRLEGLNGFTALHIAALKGRCAIAKLLLSMGAYVDGKSCHVTPTHIAVGEGHDSTLKILLDHNADPNKEVNLSTPLLIALRTPSLPCLKLLIQAGAEVNGSGEPLAVAAQRGLTEAIKCLLKAGANPNVPDMYGRIPIELAAVYGTCEDVEILFPFTSPIPTVTNWSVDGIINHMKLQRKQLEDDDFIETKKSELRKQGDIAYGKQDYINASAFYTQAMRVDHYDATLLSSRCLCWLSIGDGRRALRDAVRCKILQPKWAKAYLQKGQALILLKDYEEACDVLTQGLELDPLNDELDKLYWEAMELKDGSRVVA
ncbi:hypothetical protein HU200_045014 [Digitaria exilis]|uniref:Serine/threonine-protein kinase BSK1-like TPR repeats domain-containing protein n=1 Tax=Digitaria exilis TaxID=1010633 RepID=A0A835B1H2_9POAL|nr:hypothetical protein HU200_045014 [Digitaria exilis]